MTDINNGSSVRQSAVCARVCISGGGVCFCHSSFCAVRSDGPSQAMQTLQPTHTHNYAHKYTHTHTDGAADARVRHTEYGKLCMASFI